AIHFLEYDPASGQFQLDVDDSRQLTTLEIESGQSLFAGARPAFLDGLFDVFQADRIFKLNPDGFGDLDFGAVLPTELTYAQVAEDLCVRGSMLGGGAVSSVLLRAPGSPNGQLALSGCDQSPPATTTQTVQLDYNAITGDILVDLQDPDDLLLTVWQMETRNQTFLPTERPNFLDGLFDHYTEGLIFRLDPAGFGDLLFESILPPNLTAEELHSELCARGAFEGGLSVPDVRIAGTEITLPQCSDETTIPAPEPPSFAAFRYDQRTGGVTLSAFPALATLEILSENGWLVGPAPSDELTGLFDSYDSKRLFKMDPNGFGVAEFGPILSAGLSVDSIATELSIDGTFWDGSPLEQVIWDVVPEPSGMAWLIGCMAVAQHHLLRGRRKVFR
ncbi:MAG: hypothetical protein KDA87_24480, partial [Planctomycetales bacterium]|nr:hypothetical protein [Planctomycetales bacterium]